jgi:general secretion pathway protein E
MAASPQIASLLGRRGRLELDEVLAALVVDGYALAEDARAPGAARWSCIRWW